MIYPECSLSIPNYFSVRNRIKAFNPDIIHITTEFGIGFCGLKVAQDLSIPIVKSYHTNFDRYLHKYRLTHLEKPYWNYMKWFHNYAKVTLCPSNNTIADLDKRGIQNLDIWSRGIDLEHFNPNLCSEKMRKELGGENKLLLLYVGRLAKEKGLDTLIQSIHIVNKCYQNKVQFIFTGDGPYLKELTEANIPNAIFTGAKGKKELGKIYASCDIFMFPSGTETFGNVVLEAMGSGLAVTCVDQGGITDFTTHMQNAYVCEFNHVKSLAKGMTELIENQQLREQLSRGALLTARSRQWDSIFDGLVEHYKYYARSRSEAYVQTQTDVS